MSNYTHPDLSQWQHDRFGMFIHWGVYSMIARHEWCMRRDKLSADEHQFLIDNFMPDLFEPKEWARLAKEAGMKYVIFTTKHHDGFCMWDTKYTESRITNSPFKRDALKEVVEAFRAEGIKIGLYYSISDWTHPDYLITDDSNHAALLTHTPEEIEKLNEGRDMARYSKYMRDQVTELLTQYGEILEFWFDVSGVICPDLCESEKMYELIRSLQPNIILNNRLKLEGSEDIITPENYLRDADCFDEEGNSIPWEGCHTLSASWCYNRDELSYSKTPLHCLSILITQTSLNGNTLLNIGPTSRGYVCKEEREKLELIAHWMKYNSRSIYGCGSAPKDIPPPPPGCRYTYNAELNRLYIHFMHWPSIGQFALAGLRGRIKYAQTLHDGARVTIKNMKEVVSNENLNPRFPDGAEILQLMSKPDDMEFPVIECFLT